MSLQNFLQYNVHGGYNNLPDTQTYGRSDFSHLKEKTDLLHERRDIGFPGGGGGGGNGQIPPRDPNNPFGGFWGEYHDNRPDWHGPDNPRGIGRWHGPGGSLTSNPFHPGYPQWYVHDAPQLAGRLPEIPDTVDLYPPKPTVGRNTGLGRHVRKLPGAAGVAGAGALTGAALAGFIQANMPTATEIDVATDVTWQGLRQYLRNLGF